MKWAKENDYIKYFPGQERVLWTGWRNSLSKPSVVAHFFLLDEEKADKLDSKSAFCTSVEVRYLQSKESMKKEMQRLEEEIMEDLNKEADQYEKTGEWSV